MPAPELSDVSAWRNIIARRGLHDYTPEKLLAIYDARATCLDPEIVAAIEKHLLLVIERILRTRLGSSNTSDAVSESKHEARSCIHDAMNRPDSNDGRSLRRRFRLTVINRCVDAMRRRIRYGHRYESLEALGDRIDDHNHEPVYLHDELLVQSIDITKMISAEAHAGRRMALEMIIKGYTQEEIASAVGVDVRTVQEWYAYFRRLDHFKA